VFFLAFLLMLALPAGAGRRVPGSGPGERGGPGAERTAGAGERQAAKA
jgi:hypothetical protein